jgi:hypothetical protein
MVVQVRGIDEGTVFSMYVNLALACLCVSFRQHRSKVGPPTMTYSIVSVNGMII